MVKVTAKTEESAEFEFDYEFGEDIQGAIKIFGEDVVWAHALRGLTVAVQGHARTKIKAGKSAEEIASEMAEWKPGTPRVAKSQEEKAMEALNALSPEARAKILKDLRASQKAA